MIDWVENGPKNILNKVLDIFVYFVINVHWIIIDQYIGIKNRWLGPKLFKVQVGIGGNFSIFCNTITKATLFTHVHKASTRKFYGQKFMVENPRRLKNTDSGKKLMREKSIKRLFMIWYGSVLSDPRGNLHTMKRICYPGCHPGVAKYVWLIIQKRPTLRS